MYQMRCFIDLIALFHIKWSPNLSLPDMNQTDVACCSLSRLMKGRERKQSKKMDVCFHTPAVCHLVLSTFLYRCQSICSICLSSVYKEERQTLEGSADHYPLLSL